MRRAAGAVLAGFLGLGATGCAPRAALPPKPPPAAQNDQPPKPVPADAGKDLRPNPSPRDVVAAWEKAGATTGWMSMSESGILVFRSGGEGKAGEVPAFRFRAWGERLLSQLPSPDQPFGLDLFHTEVADAALKEVAGLKQLQRLDLAHCKGVTDAGVKELAALKQLQTLNLQETEVTDAGVKELAALKQMQTLNLSFCSGVTDAGVKELAALKELQTLDLDY
ncbi:MAG TPA: hypothetical protein VMS17_20475 [Gemmataceae bacterium]|nr:hypothetical protein [Gemmataceae bacterium]